MAKTKPKQPNQELKHKGPHYDSQPMWSVTRIDHLGNTKCFGHYPTHGQALTRLDFLEGENTKLNLSVLHHFTKCVYCGVNIHVRAA